jgi:uncharacterized RDD family membrane protein YckC
MFCSNCGSALPEGSKFCGNCGTALAAPIVPPAPPQPAHPASATSPHAWRTDARESGTAETPFSGYLPSHIEAPDLYAGFWRRVVSYFIDGLILFVPLVILIVLLVVAAGGSAGAQSGSTALVWLIALLGVWLYFALFERSHLQATPGKLALGLRVTNVEGERIGFGRATGRYFGKLLSGAILDIGYMMAGWTACKQGLHDMMAGCLVVRRDGLARLRSGEPWPAGTRAPGMPGWAIALVVVAVCFFLVIPILAAIAIPAYQNYLVRSQVSEGIVLAAGAKVAIAEYDSNRGSFPRNNAEAGLAAPSSITGMYVSSVTVGTLRDGTGGIRVDFSDASNSVLHGKYLLLIAQPQADGTLQWSCADSTVDAKYMPSSCREP